MLPGPPVPERTEVDVDDMRVPLGIPATGEYATIRHELPAISPANPLGGVAAEMTIEPASRPATACRQGSRTDGCSSVRAAAAVTVMRRSSLASAPGPLLAGPLRCARRAP